MSWRDKLANQLYQATFRGIPFFVQESERATGRNTVIDDLVPQNDKEEHIPYVADNGIAIDKFDITGYVIANFDNDFDYFENRDALINALRTQGTGELNHPFYGIKQVRLIGQAQITESLSEGGIARFKMSFAEVKDIEPVKTSDFQNKVKDRAKADLAIVGENFTKNWYTGGLFQNVAAQSFKNMLKNLNSIVRDIKGVVNANISNTIADIADAINQVDSLIDLPFDTFTLISNTVSKLVSLCQYGVETVEGGVEGLIKIETGIAALIGISNQLQTDPLAQGFIPDEQTGNVRLIDATFKAALVGAGAEIGIDTNFISQSYMEKYSGLFADAIDDLLTQLGELDNADDIFQAVEDIRGVYIDNLMERISGLKKEKDYPVRPEIKSALCLAYDLYADIEREQEIIDRNKLSVRHPGFLPAGELLKVLNE